MSRFARSNRGIESTNARTATALEVHPNGSKLWRYKYAHLGKDKRVALGRYPDVGLADARRKRDEAKRTLADGTDPLAERKRAKLLAIFNGANSFGDLAKEY